MARFIGVDNMRTVLAELEPRVRESTSGVIRMIEAGTPPVRQVVFDVMVDIAQDDAYRDLSVDEMNEEVVDTVMRFYEQLAADQEVSRASQTMATSAQGTRAQPALPAPNPTLNTMREGARPGISVPLFDGEPETTVTRCISIEGGHRDTTLFPQRYRFAYDLAEPIRSVSSVVTSAIVLPVVHHTINATHLLLMVEELPSAYSFNSGDVVRRAFSKLVPKSQYSAVHTGANPRQYVVLEPIATETRTFDPPIPSLSRFTVSLVRPNGQAVSDSKDDIVIASMALGNMLAAFTTYTLKATKAFRAHEVQEDDLVVLSGCDSGNADLDAYINRPEGHVVVADPLAGAGPVAGVSITISESGHMDDAGNMVPMPGTRDVFGAHNIKDGLQIRVLNVSTQMSITLEAKCAHSGISSAPP